jgi:hypothetical protein
LIVFFLSLLGCSTKNVKKTTPKTVSIKKDKATKEVPKKKDPRSFFTFDKKGNVKTKSGNAEKTFKFPDIKLGFVFDVPRLDILPILAVELFEFKKVPFYFDVGVAPHLFYLSIGYNVIRIFEVGVFLWVGYNFVSRKGKYWGREFYGMAFGFGMTILRF